MSWIIIAVSLIVGNYLYQAITHQNWEAAFERSFFQLLAVLVVYWVKPWEW